MGFEIIREAILKYFEDVNLDCEIKKELFQDIYKAVNKAFDKQSELNNKEFEKNL